MPGRPVGRSRPLTSTRRTRLTRMTYRIDEVAEMLGLGRTTIFKLLEQGELRRVKVGARTLILASDVDALIQRRAA